MKIKIAILVALGAVTLTACGSKTDANEKNFSAAMNQYFDKKGNLCLNTKEWPVDLKEIDLRLQKTMPNGSASRMAALEVAGLVKGEETEVDVMGIMGKPTGDKEKIKRYTLTDKAKPFLQEREVDLLGLDGERTEKQVDLCWGKQALDRIVKWEGPMQFGDYKEAMITYTYKVLNIADWAKMPEVQAAFPALKRILDGAASKESTHVVKLTSQGWEAKGLN